MTNATVDRENLYARTCAAARYVKNILIMGRSEPMYVEYSTPTGYENVTARIERVWDE